ncbi:ArsR/SmtB family transcription factor [Nocardioides massiliensis]|uniref:DNA-binding transcriptional ArsR family regulator n=1 Tax=Nocardioides massiliensis TaxID=1325935 RepID=A0ABT9NJ57_9ACTN|nr:winged helix-turn-helix domain-containing protein [Nocardioides massiliensis]MDP9820262.1 DNA-binding transcriptional ArsR family regulator [Nocardioides massiliensis]
MTEAPITDPIRMRALAHPLRLQLMDVLAELGEATATECAARVGESVASCSFHLRQLAKYGFVEPAERRGRERPWRRTADQLTTRPDPGVPGSLDAATELGRLHLHDVVRRAGDALARVDEEPAEWVGATTLRSHTVLATADELVELAAAMDALLAPYVARRDDPDAAPATARRAQVVALMHLADGQ